MGVIRITAILMNLQVGTSEGCQSGESRQAARCECAGKAGKVPRARGGGGGEEASRSSRFKTGHFPY